MSHALAMALWFALGAWCVVWLNVTVDSTTYTRTERETFDDMAW